jgi:hypothetical protein
VALREPPNRYRKEDTMRKLALLLTSVLVGVAPSVASAHNAGYIYLDGRCLEVGSSKEAPIVGAGNPNQNALGQLDLIYDARNGTDVSEQNGARWAAIQGRTPILPRVALR